MFRNGAAGCDGFAEYLNAGLVYPARVRLQSISKWRSGDLHKEFMRLDGLRLQATIKCGPSAEIEELQQVLRTLCGDSGTSKRRATMNDKTSLQKKVKM